ncbi:MAG: PssD/Cps14F family polysaccharide biosynthesis glycosyltransferase [Dethiobacteria bacterium]
MKIVEFQLPALGVKNMSNNIKDRYKLCMISSSGGHYEQLKMLAPLSGKNELFWVTEKTDYDSTADYYLIQTGLKDKAFPLKMIINFFSSIKIWYIERPDFVITTGTMIVLPMAFLAKLFRKKLIYIESFSRIYDGSRTGRLMYKYADLFIIQWESLREIYPKAVYGGSIY